MSENVLTSEKTTARPDPVPSEPELTTASALPSALLASDVAYGPVLVRPPGKYWEKLVIVPNGPLVTGLMAGLLTGTVTTPPIVPRASMPSGSIKLSLAASVVTPPNVSLSGSRITQPPFCMKLSSAFCSAEDNGMKCLLSPATELSIRIWIPERVAGLRMGNAVSEASGNCVLSAARACSKDDPEANEYVALLEVSKLPTTKGWLVIAPDARLPAAME